MSFDRELEVAIKAVRAAARVCRGVQQNPLAMESMQKQDESPVTVADFASQAIICRRLAEAFPDDPVVAEEGVAELRKAQRGGLSKAIARALSPEFGAEKPTPSDVLDWIDHGAGSGSSPRFWTLDPIDGTRGFLRDAQYAIALALIEEGFVVAAVLACPKLPVGQGGAGTGALFAARRGQGAHACALWDEDAQRGAALQVDAVGDPAAARFCESAFAGHSNQKQAAEIAARLGITRPPLRLDSQCKYAAVARGDASIYLRLPTKSRYREKIWDHAAGMMLVEEAGGRVSDTEGRALDFRCGRELDANRGIVASSGPLHERVLEALRQTRA